MGNYAASAQTEVLFNEINKLIRRNSFSRAILQLKLLNSSSTASRDIEIYDFIIENIVNEYTIEPKVLFSANGKYDLIDARRSTYVFLHKYLELSHKSIAIQFDKQRATITVAINEFKKMEKDKEYYERFFDRHDRMDEKIKEFIRNISPKSN